MTVKEFRNLSIGDIIVMTQNGLDKNKKCKVVDIIYDKCGWPIPKFELLDPNEIFMNGDGKGKRQRTSLGYVNLKLISKGS